MSDDREELAKAIESKTIKVCDAFTVYTLNDDAKAILVAALRSDTQSLKEALAFYADMTRYWPVEAAVGVIGFKHGEIHDRDRGAVARAALKKAAPQAAMAGARNDSVAPQESAVAAVEQVEADGLDFPPGNEPSPPCVPATQCVAESPREEIVRTAKAALRHLHNISNPVMKQTVELFARELLRLDEAKAVQPAARTTQPKEKT